MILGFVMITELLLLPLLLLLLLLLLLSSAVVSVGGWLSAF